MNENEFKEEFKEFEHMFNIIEEPNCLGNWRYCLIREECDFENRCKTTKKEK